MGTKAVFTMKLEPDLRDSFMAETAAADRPASQVVRELMRDYIEQRCQERAYSEYLGRKVDNPHFDGGWSGTLSRGHRGRFRSQTGEALRRFCVIVLWVPEAEQDRIDIMDYIAADNPAAAIRMDQLFGEAASRLADHPFIGKPGLIPHPSYRLVCTISQNTIWVLALVHTARSWP